MRNIKYVFFFKIIVDLSKYHNNEYSWYQYFELNNKYIQK
jgi:hypothetical protein